MLRQEPVENVPLTEAGFLQVYRGFETFLKEGRRQARYNDYFLAIYYAQLGNRDRAFELLDRAIEARVPVLSYIMVDPRIDPLRGDPRFRAALERMKFGRPPDRTRVGPSVAK
jgi:hypothetical protein